MNRLCFADNVKSLRDAPSRKRRRSRRDSDAVFGIISFFSEKKEPHDGTHHGALEMAPISYDMPSVESVGSSIVDVTANPLSAWKAAMASWVIGPSIPSTGPS